MQNKTLGSPGVLFFVRGCGMLAETKGRDHMKQKWDWKNAAMAALLFGMGMALGLAAVIDLYERVQTQGFGGYLFSVAWLAVAAVLAVYGQIILHEGGHLVCGLATGYRFVSFRIGSWMLQRANGKFCIRKMTLAGTGGQCLLAPPPLVDGKMPYLLYNLGGPLANLLTAVLCAWGMHFGREVWGLRVLFQLSALVGVGMFLTNGIPLQCNDGANALAMSKDPAAVRSLWVQLSVNAQQAEGVRLKDMPEEWFALPAEAGLQNSMTAVLAVLCENRWMDERRFDEAATLIDRLNEMPNAIMPLHRELLLCDRLYLALLRGEDAFAWLAEWETKEMHQFRKQMADFLGVLRTEYAAALHAGDAQAAAQFRERFEQRSKSYPYPAEVQSERELLELLSQN